MGKINRQQLLDDDLKAYGPKKWRINIPFKDYSFRVEDIVPALSGAIGKISLVAAFAGAWAAGFNISDPSFATENVRLEIFVASIFAIIFCAFLNPYAGPPGTHAALIPMVPAMVAAGVHPLPLGILIGILGLGASIFKYFEKVVAINREGTKAGVILLSGFIGISSSLENLKNWSSKNEAQILFALILVLGIILYIALNKFKLKWLIIPACALTAILISSCFSIFPEFKTGIGFPIINPSEWWNEKWGIGWGLNAGNFVKALPFALLAVVMWPPDALAIRAIAEANYPKEAKKAVFDMNSTYFLASIRDIAGVLLGGAQIAAVWRSFMIPLATVKRPIGASALMLGIFGLTFGILGFPIDMAVFPPLLWMVLIFGVYVPLVEVGLANLKTSETISAAIVCIVAGIAINPVLGWAISLFAENFGFFKNSGEKKPLSKKDLFITAFFLIITVAAFLFANFLK